MKRTSIALICTALSLTGCSKTSKKSNVEKTIIDMPVIESYVNAYMETVDSWYGHGIAMTLSEDGTYHDSPLGYRTAGSDAEHRAAEYLAGIMSDIGLEVEQSPISVDKWQFSGASLAIEDTDISLTIGSYPQSGTPPEGITAKIVDVGTGFRWDYDNIDVTGKIVIAGVDLDEAGWLDAYITEAYNHGAVAFITYSMSDYDEYNTFVLKAQDTRCEDLIPCAMVSYNDYVKIAKAISLGHDNAHLMIDSVIEDNEGFSYNVIGRLPGKSSDNQIVVAAHYDMYFKSFQDDCLGVGMILAMAKGMIDTGYQPENDILFVCHGAKEWGATDTTYDWSIGSWSLLKEAHPEWVGKTLALLNIELPAVFDKEDAGYVRCVPEFSDLFAHLVKETNLIASSYLNVYPYGIYYQAKELSLLDDSISYRNAGIPCFTNYNLEEGNKSFYRKARHATSDVAGTYHDHIMRTNLNTFGSLLIYLDQMPALELNIATSATDLLEGLDKDIATDAGIDYREFKRKIDDLCYYAEEHNNKIYELNMAYLDAINNGEDTTRLREEGRRLNAISLNAFKYVQDHFIGASNQETLTTRHGCYQENVDILDHVIAALEAGVLFDGEEKGALDQACLLNASHEWQYYQFSPNTVAVNIHNHFREDNMFWATGKTFTYAETSEATISLLEKNENHEIDYTREIEIYRNARDQQQRLLKEAVEEEYNAMDELILILQ